MCCTDLGNTKEKTNKKFKNSKFSTPYIKGNVKIIMTSNLNSEQQKSRIHKIIMNNVHFDVKKSIHYKINL